ncbi:hypothetical protein DSO57_1029398 [Entomophthora muscae]|uniref:Uncharacterized protein n=1 Tax=Entomophthora muscae TaxID=34485 RepID=A0ACC2SE35_9FUNG|nr:hypothetical protein DSO57_1029398 [Entomophthora muscae]
MVGIHGFSLHRQSPCDVRVRIHLNLCPASIGNLIGGRGQMQSGELIDSPQVGHWKLVEFGLEIVGSDGG